MSQEVILKNKMELLRSDNAYFSYRKGDKLIGQVVIHVDDFFISGSEEFVEWFLKMINDSLKV